MTPQQVNLFCAGFAAGGLTMVVLLAVFMVLR